MVPALISFDFHWDFARLWDGSVLLNLIFLGLGASALVLKEQITVPAIIGTVLTLAGLLLSEIKFDFRKRDSVDEY